MNPGLERQPIKAAAAPLPRATIERLIALYRRGRLAAVIGEASALVDAHPHAADLQNILGAANAGLGHFEAAIGAYEAALEIKPDYADAHINLGNVLKEQGALDAALDRYAKAAAIMPRHPLAQYNMGIIWQEKGALDTAIACYTAALRIKPDHAEAHYNKGRALQDKGAFDAALASYATAAQIKPDYCEPHVNSGNILQDKGQPDAALASYAKALRIKPDHAEAHYNTGKVLQDKGALDAAIDAYTKAVRAAPDFAEAYHNMGVALQDKGALEVAIGFFEKTLSIKPGHAECLRNYANARTMAADDPVPETVAKLLSHDALPDHDRMHLSFAMAKAMRDAGNAEAAMSNLGVGNALRKAALGYSIDADRQLFSEIRSAFRNLACRVPQPDPASTKSPIFILGMPRSGTTLVEQILSSHSDVFGAGELGHLKTAVFATNWRSEALDRPAFDQIRLDYLAKLNPISDRSYIVDKMPLNFRWIGFILSAMAEARIIHVQRDPMAVCWSNYKTYFPAPGMAFAFDQTDIAAYYNLYRDLMEFWRAKFPDRIYDFNYDDLVEDPETQTRQLLDSLGLDWQDSVLDFHRNNRVIRTASNIQVRQDIFKHSSVVWKTYEPWLQPMIKTLGYHSY